jgi:hypothetical protein
MVLVMTTKNEACHNEPSKEINAKDDDISIIQ